MADIRNRVCPLCNCENHKIIYRDCGFNIVKCTNCKYMYMSPVPLTAALQGFYNEKYQCSEKDIDKVVKGFAEGKHLFFDDRLELIKKHIKAGKLLDVGCNYGIFLKLAKENNYDVYGVDISYPAVEYAKDKFKLNVIQGTLKRANFPSDYFDIISMFDVIEHIEDPLSELIEINRVLKKDGLLFMTTPNTPVYLIKARVVKIFPFLAYYKGNFPGTPFKANEFGLPYHINYATPKTLKRMLLDAGFKNIEFDLCKKEKYYGRHFRNFLRMSYTLLTWLFFKLFRIYIPAEISVCVKK